MIVVSPVVWTDKPLVNSSELQDRLAGLAVVAELQSKWVAYGLTEALGKPLSCFDGAVRIYWPGLSVDSDPREHRLFLQNSLQVAEMGGKSLSRYLFRQMAAIAAFRFAEGETLRSVRAAIEREWRANLDALIEQSKRGAGSDVDRELLDLALGDNERMTREVAELRGTIQVLESDLATARLNVVAMATAAGRADEELGSGEIEEEGDQEPETTLAALEQIAAHYSDVLTVYKSARDSAEAADFARPDDVFKGLLAIAEVGRQYFAAKGKGAIGPWDEQFKKRGLKYAPTESQNTLNMYGKDRQFTHEGRKTQMLKHLTIGKGDTKNCLQIYFEPNSDARKIEIGWCGRHLPYYGKGT